jgi:hypothetical protein
MIEPPLSLNLIHTDDAIKPRLELDRRWIEALAKAIRQDCKLPPVVCFYDGDNYWLADGLDRLEAAKLAEQKTILADIRQGSRQEAISYSKSGSRRNKEKQQVVDRFLELLKFMGEEEKKYWSNIDIGAYCAVSNTQVSNRMKEVGYKQPSALLRKSSKGEIFSRDISKVQQNRKSTSKGNGFNWAAIDDKQFEKLVSAIVKAHHPVEIKPKSGTGGKGRDLEAKFISKGSLGEHREEIYFIEAKHHQSGVSPDDISGAFTWAQAEQPSALVIAVSSNLTNPCKDSYIPSWTRNNPKVRVIVWEREHIEDFIKFQPSTGELAIELKLISKSRLSKLKFQLSNQVLEEYQNRFIDFLEKMEKTFGISIDTHEVRSKLLDYGFSALSQHHIGKSCEDPEVGSVMITAFTRTLNDIEPQKNT